MAIVKKTKTRPAEKYESVVAVICELCKTQYKDDDWGRTYYEHLECKATLEVHLEEGTSYPEGGSYESQILDICPKCFKEKLVPWFISQGGVVRNKDVDF